jgi:hypothetical protein
MAEPTTADDTLARLRETLAVIVRVPKHEVLRMERLQKDKRERKRTGRVAAKHRGG